MPIKKLSSTQIHANIVNRTLLKFLKYNTNRAQFKTFRTQLLTVHTLIFIYLNSYRQGHVIFSNERSDRIPCIQLLVSSYLKHSYFFLVANYSCVLTSCQILKHQFFFHLIQLLEKCEANFFKTKVLVHLYLQFTYLAKHWCSLSA